MDKIELTIIDIIEKVIIKENEGLIYPDDYSQDKYQKSPYIKFLPLIVSIEFLGACYDEFPFETTRLDKEDIVEKRFNKALKKLFNKRYHPYCKKDSELYFYKKLRCTFVHQLRTGKGISFTTRKESIEDGNTHLKKDLNGNLILVLEDFFDDLKKAAQKMIRLFKDKKITNQKGELAFIEVVKYN